MAYLEVARLTKRFVGVVGVDGVSFEAGKGELVTLLGPSGCGKTTTMRCIAGLEEPEAGEIRIDGETVTSVAEGVFVQPERRGLGMVFQSYALWPHLSVFDNVSYGLKARRVMKADLVTRTEEALRLVELLELRHRRPSELSGGQQQRVALARALAYQPKLLLLDEPLSNLDAKLRERMREELRYLVHRIGVTSVYVTHDQIEALSISDRIVVMSDGRVKQVGDPKEIYARPAGRFVAQFVGAANMLEARVRGQGDRPDTVLLDVGDGADGFLLHSAGPPGHGAGEEVLLCIRPEDLSLRRERPTTDLNVLACEVEAVVFQGNLTLYRLGRGRRTLQVQTGPEVTAEVGERVFVVVDPARIWVIADAQER